jgi:hypothetical protein
LNVTNKGTFTLAAFVGDNANDNTSNSNMRLLALATLNGVTEIGSFLFASCHQGGQGKYNSDCRCHRHYRAKLRQCKYDISLKIKENEIPQVSRTLTNINSLGGKKQ